MNICFFIIKAYTIKHLYVLMEIYQPIYNVVVLVIRILRNLYKYIDYKVIKGFTFSNKSQNLVFLFNFLNRSYAS